MSATATQNAESQTACQLLRIKQNQRGNPEFEVTIRIGDWYSDRKVEITDHTISPAIVIAQIAAKNTTVTQVQESEGKVVIDHDGHNVIVGKWTTSYESEDVYLDMDISIASDPEGPDEDRIDVTTANRVLVEYESDSEFEARIDALDAEAAND